MQCSTLECYSEAVAKSKLSGDAYCIECAIKVCRSHGVNSVLSISNAKFPWRYPIDGQCPHCGNDYNKYLIGLTGECANCRKDFPMYKVKD